MIEKNQDVHYREMLTVSEVAHYLNLNEKMIYRLVKNGRLPGTKVTGKWTFPRHLIRQWMEANALKDVKSFPTGPGLDTSSDLFLSGSNDLVIDHIVSLLLRRNAPDSMVYFANTGSLQGLRSLATGKAHLAGIHLYSPETDTYNTTFVRKYLPGKKAILFNLAFRQQGLILRAENGSAVKSIRDLLGLRMVNRETGSGTRLLLDLLLDKEGLDPLGIEGYGNEVSTHLEVGLSIMRMEADIGLGIEPVARMLGLHFLPLASERFDIVVPVDYIALAPVESFLEILQSKDLKAEVSSLPGYNFERMGMIMH